MYSPFPGLVHADSWSATSPPTQIPVSNTGTTVLVPATASPGVGVVIFNASTSGNVYLTVGSDRSHLGPGSYFETQGRTVSAITATADAADALVYVTLYPVRPFLNAFQGRSPLINRPAGTISQMYNQGPFAATSAQLGASPVDGGTSCVTFGTPTATTSVEPVYGNVSVNGGGEYHDANAATLTVRSSIVYNGTVYPVWFGGTRTTTVEVGAFAKGRAVVQMPPGALYNVLTYVTTPAGKTLPAGVLAIIAASAVGNLSGGDNFFAHGGNGSDQTGNASSIYSWGTTSNAYTYGPMSVLTTGATNNAPSVALLGDSILAGYALAVPGTSFAVRALVAANVGYHLLATPGETGSAFVANSACRQMLLEGCTDAISNYGTNDISYGLTVAQVKAKLLAVWALCAAFGVSVRQTTILPRVSTTDAGATIANQTPLTSEPVRLGVNAWLRAPASAGAGNSALYDAGGTLLALWDTAALIEVNGSGASSIIGGRWPANGSADGVHPVDALHQTLAAAIQASQITVPQLAA